MGITDLSPAHDQVYTPHCPALSTGAAMYVFSVICDQMSAHVLVLHNGILHFTVFSLCS